MVLRCPPLGRGCTGRGEKRCLEGKGRADRSPGLSRAACLSVLPMSPAALGQYCAKLPWTPSVSPGKGQG